MRFQVIPCDAFINFKSLRAISRLFRMISDTISPNFHVEDRQWRSSVIEIFYYYFGALWDDDRVSSFRYIILKLQCGYQEEIRLAVDTFSATLLPAHFEAISLCWGEALKRFPVTERLRLVSFLIQLHPHYPQWQGKGSTTFRLKILDVTCSCILGYDP